MLLAYQVRTKEDVSLLRSVTVTAISPLAKALDNARGSSMGFLDRYFLLLRVEQENERLKTELDRMKLENQFLRTELTTRLEHDDQVDLSVMGRILELYFGGDLEASIALTGQVAGRIESVRPVADIVHDTVREFRQTVNSLQRHR